MALTLIGWRGPAGAGNGASLPEGIAGQLVGYGPGGAIAAVNAPDWTTLASKPAAFPPSAHVHVLTDVAGIQSALDDKADVEHSHPWADITGRPATFPPAAHTHVVADITGLQADLDGKAAVDHTHAWAAVTDKPATFPATVAQFAAYSDALAFSTANPTVLVFSEEEAP